MTSSPANCVGGNPVLSQTCLPICTDADGDGYKKEGGACGAQDCNDNNESIHPGAPEICGDNIDNNCNGQTNENCCPTVTGFSPSGSVNASGRVSLSFSSGVDGVYDSATITLNGQTITGTSWSDQIGGLVREGGNSVKLTVHKAGCADVTTSRLINVVKDTLGRMTAKSYPDGTQTTFSYDAKGNLLMATNPNIAYTFAYDASDRLATVADSFGHQLDYVYDAAGRRTRVGSSAGIDIAYAYDDAGRLAQIDSPVGELTFGYDSLGRRNKLTFPNGVTTTYKYDDLGRLTDLVSAAAAGIITENHYTHDKVGNRLSNRDARSTMSYGYDAIYRLSEAVSNAPGYSGNTTGKGKGTATATQNQMEFYVYDPVGNRLQTDKVKSTTHNAGNELLSADGTRYEYDANGNRISKTTAIGTTTYAWDVENRLTQVTLPDGKSVTYAYDPFGRRIAKTADGITTRYTYDVEDIHFETENGKSGNVYIHGPGIDEPFALLDNKGPSFYHADGLGSIVVLTDSNAKVVQRYEYDSFGNRKDIQNTIKQPYTYTGREHDRETRLYYYRARYYDAEIGGFISKDPIAIGGNIYTRGVNITFSQYVSAVTKPYAYTENDPINFTDPLGLFSVTGGAGLGGGIHLYFIGVNAHSRVECGSGGCYTITSLCGRLGPGMYLGGGTEVGGSIGPDNESNDQCEEACEDSWSLGAGADVAFGNEGAGGSASGGPSGLSVGGTMRSPLSLGIGISLGIEGCYNKKCPIN